MVGRSDKAWQISSNGGFMLMNRFCIDEDAAFEFSGVYSPFVPDLYPYLSLDKLQPKETRASSWKKPWRVIDSVLEEFTESKKDLVVHVVYTRYYFDIQDFDGQDILTAMKRLNIKTVMVTIIDMWRYRLITKEKMESYCRGGEDQKDSFNDDLESMFMDIRNGNKPVSETHTYFLPKLTRKQLKLAESRDKDFFETLMGNKFADVAESEMKLSESDSKFVRGICERKTFVIDLHDKIIYDLYDKTIRYPTLNIQ